MYEHDTVELLKECDAGIEMGISGIDDVLDYVKSSSLKEFLVDNSKKHHELKLEINELLDKYNLNGESSNKLVKAMSRTKTKLELLINKTDEKIADIITDGCNMGIKSLNKYLNKYESASELAKGFAKRLISLETKLVKDIRRFL